jgi:myo-inositol-1(or 4)-monophosphatase
MSEEGLLDLATRAAHAAGGLLRERFGGLQAGLSAKSSRTDLVSDTDREAEALILAMIRRERPRDGLLAEEGGSAASASGVRWLVDPLDGTINYLWGIPHWSVSIAVTGPGGDLAGVVHDPMRGETFTASASGARMDGEGLKLTPGGDVAEALVGTGFSYVAEQRSRQARLLVDWLPHVRDVRRFGSAALDLAWVAAGRLDAFYETGLSDWDWAAGAMLVRAAGGTVTHLPAEPGGADGILAARPGLTEPLLGLLRPSG